VSRRTETGPPRRGTLGAMRSAALAATLSGRARERAALLDAVQEGLAGLPQAVLVHGEAGIGKTSLVRSVCEEVEGQERQVLWGQCLRFSAVEAMYHPLVLALEGWLGGVDEAERASVIEALPGAAMILPSLGATTVDGHSTLMLVVDALISRVVARGPTLLVVDDVQWADPATCDALSYLVAGFTRQRLALVTTHRDEAPGTDGFRRWVGNVRRLPGTQELELTRLDQDATSDQIATLLGRAPAPRLLEQVYARSRGNPYFSELLVRRGDVGDTELPEDLPGELSQALMDAWRGLSDPAREIVRILALAGRPTTVRTLTALAAGLGVAQPGVVREAVEAGVVVLEGDEVWFRHPLLAVVLAESYLPDEATPVHAAWATHLGSTSSEGVDELRRLGDLASHHELAGEESAAFDLLLQGAYLADQLGAPRQAADLLVRATDLWEAGADTADDLGRARLLERAGGACEWVGRDRDSHRLFIAARDLVSPERDPLWASELTVRVARSAHSLGGASAVRLAEMERAVELSRVDPDSREHALALSWYADALFWEGRTTEARRVADDAVTAADRSGSAAAVSRARCTRAKLVMETDVEDADVDSATCWQQAATSGEADVISDAYIVRLLVLNARGDLRRLREHARETFDWFVPRGETVFPSSLLADVLLAMGDLVAAESIVRAGLAATGNAYSESIIRLAAGRLAVRRGAIDAALGHRARAYELLPDLEQRPECEAGSPVAELFLAQNNPAAAFDLIERVLPVNAVDPRVLDELMVFGARSTADLVQQAFDHRDQTAVQRHREALTRLVRTRETLPGIGFQPSCSDDTVQPALAALFAAEVGRTEGSENVLQLWRTAVATCAGAGMEWEQQLASWRLGSALIDTATKGTEAAEVLRGVHQYADQQGALPLTTAVEEVAAGAHISLTRPKPPPSGLVPAAFAGLTEREKEVLAHLVAHRTNAEIAEALFISEKTVSVHVSNLLRKTACRSRREVAALARRVGWAADN
jgi:DNA-binding CsgD family transcriptional regulator/tetratricopeptide (TPR) repeat protein